MKEVLLDVKFIDQEEDFFCGPAVALMILRFHRAKVSPSSTKAGLKQAPGRAATRADLERLWCAISLVPPDAPYDPPPGPCQGERRGVFQLFYRCDDASQCRAWFTVPGALQTVLNDRLSARKRMITVRDDNAEPRVATTAIRDSIDRKRPAAALVGNGGSHWVVVRGYQTRADDELLEFIYIRDPQNDEGDLHMLPATDTGLAPLSVVSCGPAADADRFVVITGR